MLSANVCIGCIKNCTRLDNSSCEVEIVKFFHGKRLDCTSLYLSQHVHFKRAIALRIERILLKFSIKQKGY